MYGPACDRTQGIPTFPSRWLISLIIAKLNRRVAGNSCSHRITLPPPHPLNTPPLLHPLRDQHISLIIFKTKIFGAPCLLCFATTKVITCCWSTTVEPSKAQQLPQATCGASMRSIIIFHVGTAFLFVNWTRRLRESGVHQRSLGIIM